MTRYAIVVEGPGDEASFPALISRATSELGVLVYTPHPIKVGGWGRLKKAGQLERYVELGMRPDVDGVIISLDLDDGCPKEEIQGIEDRRASLEARFGRPVKIVFCKREYEAWFLSQIDHLKAAASEYEWDPDFICRDAEAPRDAKGEISRAIRQAYKETTDQLRLTRHLNLKRLARESRSFRKLLKEVMGCKNYEELSRYLQ